MIACRRQHSNFASSGIQSPPITNLGFFDNLPHIAVTPSPAELYNEKALRSYFAQPNRSFDHLANSNDLSDSEVQSLLMNSGFDQNPAIRVQQSTPVSHLPTTSQPSTMFSSSMGNNSWNIFGNANNMTGNLEAPQKFQTHRRAGSASSMGSEFSSASRKHASSAIATSDFNGADQQSFSNHLPTPSQTPIQESFLNQINHYSSSMASAPAMLSMKEALLDGEDEVPQFGHSSRHSVSSFGQNSPATPRGDDYDEKVRTNDISQSASKQDSTFSPQSYSSASRAQNNMLSVPGAYHPSVSERLRAANDARSSSPSNSSRGVSPFRHTSPYTGNSLSSPRPASGLRDTQQAIPNTAMKAYAQQTDAEPKTISPKDALLDYNETEEDAKMPLFSENEASAFNQQYNNGTTWDQQSNWTSSQGTTTSSVPDFNFMPSAIAASIPQIQFPFTSQQYRTTNRHEPTPDFPAHLTSMESTASEAASDTEAVRPSQTKAGRGTYSCTHQGCSERFDSAQKLQKHKREGHHQSAATSVPPITPGIGSGMSSAELMKRNSQAGPHKCNRINPTTGKPCATEFSRPYDLTRHEDTIHNNRKHKVRCALCTEEKTFSRNDALTRHMRVVHPEVNFPGKHRRRGGSD